MSSDDQFDQIESLLNQTWDKNKAFCEEKFPQINANYQALLRTFEKIDKFETLIREVKDDVTQLEASVSKAEKDFKVGSNISDVLKPLAVFRGGLEDQSRPPVEGKSEESAPQFVAPTLKFSPQKYFPSTTDGETPTQDWVI